MDEVAFRNLTRLLAGVFENECRVMGLHLQDPGNSGYMLSRTLSELIRTFKPIGDVMNEIIERRRQYHWNPYSPMHEDEPYDGPLYAPMTVLLDQYCNLRFGNFNEAQRTEAIQAMATAATQVGIYSGIWAFGNALTEIIKIAATPRSTRESASPSKRQRPDRATGRARFMDDTREDVKMQG